MPATAGVLVRVLRWLALGGVTLAALAAVLLGSAVLLNARDEALSSAARALLTAPPNRYSPADNIYVALQGFDAPPAESVVAVGQARLENPDATRGEEPQRLGFRGDISFIRPLETSVWDAAPQHEAQIGGLLAENRELLERYRDLLLLHGYYETAQPSVRVPAAAAPNEVRRLFLTQLALQMRAPRRFERQLGLAELESDIQLWRRVLTGEGTLRWKMLAIANLQSDYLLLADLIADPDVQLAAGGDYGAALVPQFDAADFDLGRAFAAEFRIQVATLRAPDAGAYRGAASWSERLAGRATDYFLKSNATVNLLARDTLAWMAAAADPRSFQRLGSPTARNAGVASLIGYNPLGTAMASELTQSYRRYPPRAWDLAALQRLVRLGYEIRRQRIAAAAIPAFLAAHPQWSTHPASGAAFLWDAHTSQLQLQTVAQHPRAWRFGIRIWQAPQPLAPQATPR
ncbi:MAG TPA: hypothetical protein VMT66_06600 [Steroidobacteraceae bacterium]|nr:hypothetical protein [Steroidobacteraceae bacterium]